MGWGWWVVVVGGFRVFLEVHPPGYTPPYMGRKNAIRIIKRLYKSLQKKTQEKVHPWRRKTINSLLVDHEGGIRGTIGETITETIRKTTRETIPVSAKQKNGPPHRGASDPLWTPGGSNLLPGAMHLMLPAPRDHKGDHEGDPNLPIQTLVTHPPPGILLGRPPHSPDADVGNPPTGRESIRETTIYRFRRW